jgi:hypothetical protein
MNGVPATPRGKPNRRRAARVARRGNAARRRLWRLDGRERAGAHARPVNRVRPFGSRIDNRESYMAAIIWAAIVGWHEECPIRPSPAESLKRMEETFAAYTRNVKTRVNGAGRVEGLEREGRGMTAFRVRWLHAMKKWDKEVADAALKNIAARQRPASEPPPPDNDNKAAGPDPSPQRSPGMRRPSRGRRRSTMNLTIPLCDHSNPLQMDRSENDSATRTVVAASPNPRLCISIRGAGRGWERPT